MIGLHMVIRMRWGLGPAVLRALLRRTARPSRWDI